MIIILPFFVHLRSGSLCAYNLFRTVLISLSPEVFNLEVYTHARRLCYEYNFMFAALLLIETLAPNMSCQFSLLKVVFLAKRLCDLLSCAVQEMAGQMAVAPATHISTAS